MSDEGRQDRWERRPVRSARMRSPGSGARPAARRPEGRAERTGTDRTPRPGPERDGRGAGRAGRGDDAVTDRHPTRRSETDGDRDRRRTGPDTSGWLLGSSDEGGAQRSMVASSGAITEAIPHGRTAARQARRRRRTVLWGSIAGLLLVALAGGLFLARGYLDVFFPPDYDGPGSGRAVVEVAQGQSVGQIGTTLVGENVVASTRAFTRAAENDPGGRGIQPGFYELQNEMPAADAVTALLDPANRLGRLEIRPGTQLDDTVGEQGAVSPGVLSAISRATCTVDDAGAERCASVEELRGVMATTDPGELGVAPWAVEGARAAAPERRLEGLLAAGNYDLAPGLGAREALEQVVRESVTRLEAGGMVEESRDVGQAPYATLVIASLAEKEGIRADFPRVTRTIFNRLALPMRLQFDSTVNYPLDRQTLRTNAADRLTPGPYNSYLNLGLPPTPIAAPSPDAIRAALQPEPGPWVYFVKCFPSGESCFSVTIEEHDQNRREAQARGAY